MYPSHVRRLLVFLTLALAVGCRAPAIPAQPSPHEYAIYSAWMEQATADIPPQRTLAVDSETLTLNQAELQFKQCLPPRMTAVFDSAPVSTLLASTSGNDWLTLGNGRSASLHPHADPLSFDRPTEFFRLSRVAFTRPATTPTSGSNTVPATSTPPGTPARAPPEPSSTASNPTAPGPSKTLPVTPSPSPPSGNRSAPVA